MGHQGRVAVTVEQCWHRVPGGTATSILGMLRALRAADRWDLVGVAAHHRHAPAAEFVPPVEVRHLPVGRRAMYETWHALRWPRVERATGPVDVVHATAVAVPPTAAPLVVTIHDLAFLADPSQPTRHGLRFFTRGAVLARERAERVLVPSEATARECRDFGIDAERIRVVPWGTDAVDPLDADDVAAARRRFGLERPYVLFVGTIEPRKNLRAVLAAMTELVDLDIELVIAGPDGWNEDLDEPMARARRAGLVTHRLGFLPPSQLAALYAGAAAFCFPSLREGFGMPVLDAMAHGAAVVTSAGTATEEVAGDAAVLVDPTDPGAIAAGLRSVVGDEGAAEQLRRRARERARAYTWARTADATSAVYAEVAR